MTADFGDDLVPLLPRLRRFALALSRSGDEADDLVQAACERALQARDSFIPGTKLDSWLFRIIRNLWFDRLRRRATRGNEVDADEQIDLSDPVADSLVEDRLYLREVWQRMQELPEHQREVLVLVCAEDLSYREAAEILDIPVGTVMSRLKRARRKISEIVGSNSEMKRSRSVGGAET